MMKGPRIVAWVVIAIMAVNMVNVVLNSGMDHGAGFDTFLAGSSNPWQLFINNDLVTGLFFMVGWLIHRERGGRLLDTVAWVWMIMWWGNIVVGAYVLLAVWQSRGDWTLFFQGRRSGALPALNIGTPLRIGAAALAVVTAVWTVQGIVATGAAPIPTFGYVMGFVPVVLSLALVAFPARKAAGAALR